MFSKKMGFYNNVSPLQTLIWLLTILFIPDGLNQVLENGITTLSYGICEDGDLSATYESPLAKRQNQYRLHIPIPLYTTNMILKFTSEASLVLTHPESTNITITKYSVPRYSFQITLPEELPSFFITLQVYGPKDSGTIPYLQSALAQFIEICKTPRIGYFDKYIEERHADEDVKNDEEEMSTLPTQDESCGRRKVGHTELIVRGQSTKSGDWPWHVAILRVENYFLKFICGGTLLSKTLVLTAAHCATIRGNAVIPDLLSVDLGKHNLIGGDVASQQREVFKVIIHPKFSVYTLDNDIALLQLKSEAVFTDYVQPACLWNNKLPTEDVFGTVVGWGYGYQDSLSSTLKQITIPIVSELTCLKSNSAFFSKKLNDDKFCAGFANGTSVCNGDSGGGLMVFEPDRSVKASGAWYVRGIVSISPSRTDAAVCDPNEYTIFTDVKRYQEWVLKYLN